MSRMKMETLRSGPTGTTPAATVVAATFPLADLTRGMADLELAYVDVVAALFSAYDYSALVALTVCVRLNTSGPTWNLGAVSVSCINAASGSDGDHGGGIYDSITLDQSGGLLRVVMSQSARQQGITCYAVANTMGP